MKSSEVVVVEKHHCSLELQFSANANVRLFANPYHSWLIIFAKPESLRSLLQELEELSKQYSPLMDSTTEKVLEKVIQYGSVLAEVSSPIWKPAIS